MDRDATSLHNALVRLRRRASIVEGIAAVPAAALSAASVWAVARGAGLVERGRGLTLAGVAGVALAMILARVLARRPSLSTLALRLDRGLHSSELIVSAFETASRDDSVARVVRRRALERLADPTTAQLLCPSWPVARTSAALILAGGVAVAGGDLLAWRLEAARNAGGGWQRRVSGSAAGEEDASLAKARALRRAEGPSGVDASGPGSPESRRPEAAREGSEAASASVEEGSPPTEAAGRRAASLAASASGESPELSRQALGDREPPGASSRSEVAKDVAEIASARSSAGAGLDARRSAYGDPRPVARGVEAGDQDGAESGSGTVREGVAGGMELEGVSPDRTAEMRAAPRAGAPTRAATGVPEIPAGFAEYLRRYLAVARELEGRR